MSKKIAFVYDTIYPFVKGGGEKRYYELGKQLVKKGHQVHLYGMKWWEGEDVIKQDGLVLHGICKPVKLYTASGRRSIWEAIYFGLNCLKLIKEDFDVVDCCSFPYFTLYSLKLVCLLKRKKLVSSWLEVWGKEYWKKYLGSLWIFGYLVERLSVLVPDQIIAASPMTAQKLNTVLGYKRPVNIVSMGIDLAMIKSVLPSKIKSDIIYVGRLIDFKNVDLLIKSVKQLKAKKPNIKLVIVGDGPENDNLHNLVKRLGLSKNVIFTGILDSSKEVYSYMKSSKVFVLPSEREGFGIVVLEANACGIPVITTNCIDNSSKDLIINNTNGLICNLGLNELAKGVSNILNNISITYTKENCSRFVKPYSWNSIVNKINIAYI